MIPLCHPPTDPPSVQLLELWNSRPYRSIRNYHAFLQTRSTTVTVYMRAKYLWGYLFKPYVDKHQQGVCNVCVRVPLWRMAVEVTSLKSIHWWGPACDPGPLRHINHDPFLLAFIRPAESYCPDSATTPPSLITSLLWPFIRLSSTLGHRYHSITTHLSGAPLIS